MKRAVQPNIKVLANYVDQLKSNFDESTHRQSKSEPSTSGPAKIRSMRELKECVRDHTLGSKFYNGIAKWNRFSVLNETVRGFRLGELSVITGPTGSGKTTFLSEYSMDLCLAGVSTLWCSLEVPIGKLITWMMIQYSRTDLSLLPEGKADEKFDEIYNKMQGALKEMYFFDQHGSIPIDDIMQAVQGLHATQKLDHLLVDNLQFMQGSARHGSNFDKYMKQDMIFSELRQLASKLNIHVTLVVHPRKEMEGADLNANSLYGGIKASQEADNIFIIQKMMKPWADPPFTKFFQIHKNRSVGDVVLGNTLKMDFDSRTKCHTIRKVPNQSVTPRPPYAKYNSYGQQGQWSNWNNSSTGDIFN